MAQKPAFVAERTSTRPPPAKSEQLLSLPSSVGIAVESLDGTFAFYRIREKLVERIQGKEAEWTELAPQDILQHLVLRTPVAVWLEDRIILRPADWVRSYLAK